MPARINLTLTPLAKSVIFAALAALPSLVLAVPDAPVQPPAPPSGVMAFDVAVRELSARLDAQPGKKLAPDQPSGILFTPAQQEAARAVFGSENPVRAKRVPGKGPNRQYLLTIPGHQYDAEDMRADWRDIILKLSVSPNGAMRLNGGMQAMNTADPKGNFTIRDARLSGQRQNNSLVGAYRFDVASMGYTMKDGTVPVDVRNVNITEESKLQGNFLSLRSDVAIKQLKFDSTSIERLHVGMRLRDMDAGTVAEWRKSLEDLKQKDSSDQANAEFLEKAKDALQRLVLRGAGLEFDDISAQYHGNKVAMKLALRMPDAQPSDFDSAEAILKKLEGSVQINVPLPVLRDITRAMAENTNRGKDNPAVDTDKLASDMYAGILGKLLADNLARMEKDALLSTIELKGGVLSVNGKSMPLEPLLAMLKQKKDETPPPEDTSTPVVMRMRDRGLEVVRLHASNGNRDALYDLCERYLDGIEVEKDFDEGIKYCRKSFDAGYYDAALKLATLYLDGSYDMDMAPVLAKVRMLADKNSNAWAQFVMYRMYDQGKGAPHDKAKALEYLRKAASNGNTKAIEAMKSVAPDETFACESSSRWSRKLDMEAGSTNHTDYRFDATKQRKLQLTLKNFRESEKWRPETKVCLSAKQPSDSACVSLVGILQDKTVSVLTEQYDVGRSRRTNAKHTLAAPIKEGEQVNLSVYAIGNQAYFAVNDAKPLQVEINFPVEMLSLVCSAASCQFDFVKPPAEPVEPISQGAQ
jgi:hypothetical protein